MRRSFFIRASSNCFGLTWIAVGNLNQSECYAAQIRKEFLSQFNWFKKKTVQNLNHSLTIREKLHGWDFGWHSFLFPEVHTINSPLPLISNSSYFRWGKEPVKVSHITYFFREFMIYGLECSFGNPHLFTLSCHGTNCL